ncbi:hypothetical protein KAJ77_05705, partial [bacterium]|nr:hypothetical protein [bacterium]
MERSCKIIVNHNRNLFVYIIWFSLLVLPVFLGPTSLSASDEDNSKTVLIMYDSQSLIDWFLVYDRGIQKMFRSSNEAVINVLYEFTGLYRSRERKHLEALRDLYISKYSDKKIDVIITAGILSADFLYEYGEEVFPDTPRVLSTIGKKAAERVSRVPNSTIAMGNIDIKGTLDTILTIHPETRRIALVAGSSPVGQGRATLARQAIDAHSSDLELMDLSGQSLENLLVLVSNLPKRTAVLHVAFVEDSSGAIVNPRETMLRISEISNRPLYSLTDADIDDGSVGGYLLSLEELGKRTAEQALLIFAGRSPDQIPAKVTGSNLNMFNWRQLKRWGINENRLPPGSLVLNREPTLWSMYKHYIIIVLVAFFILLFLLLMQQASRIRLKRAEEGLRRTNYELDDRLRFESLISGIAHRFISISRDRVESETTLVLKEVGKYFEVDRCAFLYLPTLSREKPRANVWL